MTVSPLSHHTLFARRSTGIHHLLLSLLLVELVLLKLHKALLLGDGRDEDEYEIVHLIILHVPDFCIFGIFKAVNLIAVVILFVEILHPIVNMMERILTSTR